MQIKGDSSSRHNHGAVTESLLEEVITGTIGRIQQQKKNSAARREGHIFSSHRLVRYSRAFRCHVTATIVFPHSTVTEIEAIRGDHSAGKKTRSIIKYIYSTGRFVLRINFL